MSMKNNINFFEKLSTRLFTPLIVIFIFVIIILIVYVPSVTQEHTIKSAISTAENTVKQYKNIRSYYTKNVIKKVLGTSDVTASYDHEGKNKVIPLPATFIHEISEEFTKQGIISLKLYSPFPFPNRKNRTLDSFANNAWSALKDNKIKTFSQVDIIDGKEVVRVAIADTMTQQACVDCHNIHPQTPKNDWQLNDVRGVLEVQIPIEEQLVNATSLNDEITLIVLAAVSSTVILLFIMFKRLVSTRLANVHDALQYIASSDGDLSQRLIETRKDEIGQLAQGYNQMLQSINDSRNTVKAREWLENGISEINNIIRESQDKTQVSNQLLSYLVRYLECHLGALYWLDENGLKPYATYALEQQLPKLKTIALGEGLVGQVALNKKPLHITTIPNNYYDISSSFGEVKPQSLIIYPIIYNDKVIAIIELAWLTETPDKSLTFLEMVSEVLAVSCININQNENVLTMLKESQVQSEELQTQQEELRVTNEALSVKTDAIKNQQTILEKTNREMEEKAAALEESSKYKSEFLANMSHELRTPLNSLLILSRSLAQNDDNNLSDDEVESAEVIQESGRSLLELINEILDLSKVEAGQMQVIADTLSVDDFIATLNRKFTHMAEDKKLNFNINLADNVPNSFVVDSSKLHQIITNLISNALKFTEQGEVNLTLSYKEQESNESKSEQQLIFSITDTGIGIAKEKHQAIFEAFQQADGTTSRTYGGTGLGLSIALSFAKLLGGDITLESEIGKGSRFSLNLPYIPHRPAEESCNAAESMAIATNTIKQNFVCLPPPFEDDRNKLDQIKKLILIIEDDVPFARIVFHACHRQDCQAIVATDGESGLVLASQYPIDGIVLDYMLPKLDGGEVAKNIRSNKKTKHIPIHLVSALDNIDAMDIVGINEKSTKPIAHQRLTEIIKSFAKEQKNLNILIVENDKNALFAMNKLLTKEKVTTFGVDNAQEALTLLKENTYDAIILDLDLPEISGFEFLELASSDSTVTLPTVFIYSGRDMSEEDLSRLSPFTGNVIVKSARSPERLLDEIHLFANQVANISADKEKYYSPSNQTNAATVPEPMRQPDASFENRAILLVDDDMRNTFALAKVLRKEKLKVRIASSGQQSIDMLNEHSDIELVLMDIMMPGMDGYQAMNKIRELNKFKELAIIAVTANAMPGDKEKCLAAGANDYMSKPVDVGQLLTMMKLWL
ncbi:MAG: response regulator [Colwellia sp.]|nr:response regulator [Colwellia sp.]